ncbi:MAG TPA: hypothetical protein DFS52_15500 [Myxococcales bacterium]|jgi:hypothetical protein|nr:hypothetical protein [Myxococcales bacterium]
MGTRWIDHQGQKIFVGEFTGMPEDQYIAAIGRCKDEILAASHPKGSLLFLTYCDAQTTEKVTAKWREFRDATSEVLRGSAIIGLTGFKRVMARLVSRELYFAKDETDAMDWLIKQ